MAMHITVAKTGLRLMTPPIFFFSVVERVLLFLFSFAHFFFSVLGYCWLAAVVCVYVHRSKGKKGAFLFLLEQIKPH